MTNASYLLAQSTPELTLQSWQLSLRGLLPLWLAILLFVVLGAVFVAAYLSERGKLHWGGRLAVSVLRLSLLALVLFLLCRPILLVVYEGQRQRGVPVLVDVSESMAFADMRQSDDDKRGALFALGKIKALDPLPPDVFRNPSRFEMVQGVVKHRDFRMLSDLSAKGPVRAYLFGSHLRGTQSGGEGTPAAQIDDALRQKQVQVEKLKQDGKSADFVYDSATALTDSIHEILSRKDDDLPTAIVLMTDGQDNAGKYTFSEIAARCKELGVPLHIWGVGAAQGVDLKLREVVLGDTVFAEDNLQVPVRFRAQGLPADSKIEIVLKLDGQIVKTKEIVAQSGEDLSDYIEFDVPKLKPEDAKSGENRKIQVSIRHKGLNLEDSLPSPLDVRVVESKIRVLYVEHSPRFEYRYLQGALTRDRRIEATFLLMNADSLTKKSGPPYIEEFPSTREKFFDAKYNVIILGDVAAKDLDAEKLGWIKEFVENRGGLIVISGRQHMPSQFENTPIAEMLPVDFVSHKVKLPTEERTQEYPPALTEFGERMTMMALADTPEESRETWKKLPGFFWNYPVAKLKPSGVSLLSNPRSKMGEDPMTIAATHHYGKGQVLYLGTDETWRWRSVKENKYFVRFWGQIIYQVGLPSLLGETAKRAQFALERSEAFLGQPSSIFVRLLDKKFNPLQEKEVEAFLEYEDVTPREPPIKIKLNAIAGRDGDYRGLLTNDRKGAFKLIVNNPEPYAYTYRVKVPPGHELSESAMNEAALKQLAEGSGGAFYRELDLPSLASKVTPQLASFTQRQEILLWNPLMLLAFLAIITLEWIARKMAHLS